MCYYHFSAQATTIRDPLSFCRSLCFMLLSMNNFVLKLILSSWCNFFIFESLKISARSFKVLIFVGNTFFRHSFMELLMLAYGTTSDASLYL